MWERGTVANPLAVGRLPMHASAPLLEIAEGACMRDSQDFVPGGQSMQGSGGGARRRTARCPPCPWQGSARSAPPALAAADPGSLAGRGVGRLWGEASSMAQELRRGGGGVWGVARKSDPVFRCRPGSGAGLELFVGLTLVQQALTGEADREQGWGSLRRGIGGDGDHLAGTEGQRGLQLCRFACLQRCSAAHNKGQRHSSKSSGWLPPTSSSQCVS